MLTTNSVHQYMYVYFVDYENVYALKTLYV